MAPADCYNLALGILPWKRALHVFERMRYPNSASFSKVISTCGRRFSLSWRSWSGVFHGYSVIRVITSIIIDLKLELPIPTSTRSEEWQAALSIFCQMPEHTLDHSIGAYSAMISACHTAVLKICEFLKNVHLNRGMERCISKQDRIVMMTLT